MYHMNDICPQLSCLLEGGGSGGGGGGGGGRSKKGRPNRNSNPMRGHSHRSFSVRGVACDEQEKSWTMVWGSTQRDLGITPILSQ